MSSSHNPNAVPINQLGLSNDDALLLQQAQAQVAAGGGSSSSRAASRASSHGLLRLDTGSLAQLGRHFDRAMQQIQQRIAYLSEQCEVATRAMYDESGNLVADADAEIARFHRLNEELDALDLDFDRIQNIRDIVKGFRQRAAELERDLAASSTTSSRHHHSSSSSRHQHHGHKHSHASSSRHRH